MKKKENLKKIPELFKEFNRDFKEKLNIEKFAQREFAQSCLTQIVST